MKNRRLPPVALLVGLALPAVAQEEAPAPEPRELGASVTLEQALVCTIPVVRVGPLPADPVLSRWRTAAWKRPQGGAEVMAGNPPRWKSLELQEGVLQGVPQGYVWVELNSPRDQVALIAGSGFNTLYTADGPRPGAPYKYARPPLAIHLRQGLNELLFALARWRNGDGTLDLRLESAEPGVRVLRPDAIWPDLLSERGNPQAAASVMVRSTSTEPRTLVAPTEQAGPAQVVATPRAPFTLPPLALQKLPLSVSTAQSGQGKRTVSLALEVADQPEGLQGPLPGWKLEIRSPDGKHVRTFVSGVEGSVQRYGVVPAPADSPVPAAERGILLSAHGAGVKARGQAGAYGPKDGLTVVCPSNRRPFGFNWEAWGRIDALEALADAQRTFSHDPQRIYVTGHSMGGHGAYYLGATFPDRFAVVAPAAAWPSFWTYGRGRGNGRPAEPQGPDKRLARIFHRAANGSDMLGPLAENYLQSAVYVLQGGGDKTVPPSQAKLMLARLAELKHPDVHSHFEPGKGHWYDTDKTEPGANCVDWPPFADLCARRRTPRSTEVLDQVFVTANPAVSARSHWLTIDQQRQPLAYSRVEAALGRGGQRFTLQTANVATLTLDLEGAGLRRTRPVVVTIDGVELTRPAPWQGPLTLRRREIEGQPAWAIGPAPGSREKHPGRSGPFRLAFTNDVVLVYATQGDADENAWSLGKARYDSEYFTRIANGSLRLVQDTDFDPAAHTGNVVLYGNADTNAAWAKLVDDAVQVRRGSVTLGDRVYQGPDLACLTLRPRQDSDTALVGLVAATGPLGQAALDHDKLSYLAPAQFFPDLLLWRAELWAQRDRSVLAAGYFGNDWGVGRHVMRAAGQPRRQGF